VTATYYNRTRRSSSIPLSLVRRGRILDVPVYYLLRASDLAREGLDHSGSYRFADHIYRGEPSGRGYFGRWLDARLLAMPAARAFRFRYLAARDALAQFLIERAGQSINSPIAVLSVPCGVPRELADAASDVRARIGQLPSSVVFSGIDLDEAVLAEARRFMAGRGLIAFETLRGDALDRRAYPHAFDFITCTGLTEFLDDERTGQLFRVLFDVLEPGGWFVTSGMQRRWASDYLLQLGELRIHYRDGVALQRLLAPLAFRDVAMCIDPTGLQTVVTARK
jgi:SAM-dependent methyltransferase